jgi:hypothetical protein
MRTLTLRAAQAFSDLGDGAVLTGHFDQLSRKQQSSMPAASAYNLQDGFGGDQISNSWLAHLRPVRALRLWSLGERRA